MIILEKETIAGDGWTQVMYSVKRNGVEIGRAFEHADHINYEPESGRPVRFNTIEEVKSYAAKTKQTFVEKLKAAGITKK